MTFVIKRKIDELGRLVLPIDHRNHYNISSGDAVSITIVDKGFLIKKVNKITDECKFVDALGRIVVPKHVRETFNLETKSSVEIHAAEEGILLIPCTATDTPVNITADNHSKDTSKNEVYEKDYASTRKAYHTLLSNNGGDEAYDLIKSRGIMQAIDKRFLELPHIINPEKKKAYDKCLQILDSWAMLKGCKIRGEVDYTHFDAHIEMESKFFEFFEARSFDYLRNVLDGARSITFTPTNEDEIRMTACFDYFENIGDMDKIIEEEIAKHADVVEALNYSADLERNIVLSDPIMYNFLSKAAEEAGTTPEEFLEIFESVWEENPMVILELLHNEFRKRAEGVLPDDENPTITE